MHQARQFACPPALAGMPPLAYGGDGTARRLLEQRLLRASIDSHERGVILELAPHVFEGRMHQIATLAAIEPGDRQLQSLGLETRFGKAAKGATGLCPERRDPVSPLANGVEW